MTQFSKQEKSWILYDVANSAFTMLVSTTIPIYFRSLAEQSVSEATASGIWGLATSIAVLILAVLSPFLGALADYRGMKKKIFSAFLTVGVIGLLLLSFAGSWISYLMLFVLTRLCYSACNIFYDSMLVDVTPDERMDRVSSYGYALGYIGSCIPFTIGILLILLRPFGLSTQSATQISFIITAVWWVLLTIPLLRNVRQTHYLERRSNQVSHAFSRVGQTLKKIRRNPSIFYFILAYFCYIDGVYTIIDMATAYGTALGLDTTGLLLALLVTQIVAFPSALVFGRLSGQYPSGTLIPVCIAAYAGIALFAFFLKHQWQFWVLAVVVGMFQGGIQALSRSHFAKIIPPEKSGEYFGLFDICGKGASFLGTMIVSVGSQLTGSANVGVGSIAILFVIGFVLFGISTRTEETKQV